MALRYLAPREVAAAVVFTSLMFAASPARAEPTAADKAAAEALFLEGRKLLSDGHVAEACPKLAESQRLNPGLGTMLNLADCYEKVGQTASAWGLFNDIQAEARRGGDKRGYETEAARRAMLLEPKLSKLAVNARSGGHVTGLEVKRDGQVLGAGLLGSAVPVDPGDHVIEASAPGRKPWKTVVKVEAKPGSTAVDVPELEVAPVTEGAPPAERGFWTGQRIGGAVAGGVGVIGVALGSVLGARALSKKAASNADNHCDAQNFCDSMGLSLRHEGVISGNVSTAAFIVGGVALAGGVVLILTGAPANGGKPAAALRQVDLAVGPGSLRLSGRW